MSRVNLKKVSLNMNKNDYITKGTHKGLNYVYDRTTQALEFTSGKINESKTKNFLMFKKFGSYVGYANLKSNDSLKTVKFDSAVDTSNVTDMSGMFQEDEALTSLDISHFDTSNVTNMWGMFQDDFALTSLDLSHLDTSNVTDMGVMFSGDGDLQSLDLGNNFNTGNVTNMSAMFTDDSALQSLDLSSFNTHNVTDMSMMFMFDTNLKSLTLGSHFDISNVANTEAMFGLDNLASLKGNLMPLLSKATDC